MTTRQEKNTGFIDNLFQFINKKKTIDDFSSEQKININNIWHIIWSNYHKNNTFYNHRITEATMTLI